MPGSDGIEGARNDAALHADPASSLVDCDVDFGRSVALAPRVEQTLPATRSRMPAACSYTIIAPSSSRSRAVSARDQPGDLAGSKSIRGVEQKQRERAAAKRAARSEHGNVARTTMARRVLTPSAVDVGVERREGRPVALDERDRCSTPRESASKTERTAAREGVERRPAAKVGAERSTTRLEKSASRTRSVVGRVVSPLGATSRRPLNSPATILIRCSPTPTPRRTSGGPRAGADVLTGARQVRIGVDERPGVVARGSMISSRVGEDRREPQRRKPVLPVAEDVALAAQPQVVARRVRSRRWSRRWPACASGPPRSWDRRTGRPRRDALPGRRDRAAGGAARVRSDRRPR